MSVRVKGSEFERGQVVEVRKMSEVRKTKWSSFGRFNAFMPYILIYSYFIDVYFCLDFIDVMWPMSMP